MGINIRGLIKAMSGDSYSDIVLNRNGHLIADRSIQSYIDAGMGYIAGTGNLLSTPNALQAAAITTLRPVLWVRVPSGKAIRPFHVGISAEDTGGTNQFEAALGMARSDVGNGTSAAVDWGPVNLRSDVGAGSSCTARQEATGDVSADFDCNIWRVWKNEDNNATPATAGISDFEWRGMGGSYYPLLIGPASFLLYIGGATAASVFAKMAWIEGDPDQFKAKV